MAVFGGPPKRLCVPLIGVVEWQEKLDAWPVPSLSGVEECRGASVGRVNLGMVDERGDGQVGPVPRGVFQGSLQFVVHGLGLPALCIVLIRVICLFSKFLDLLKKLLE
jgi:hypothetical protein